MPPISVHFNGSVNLPDAETVMREIISLGEAALRAESDSRRRELFSQSDELRLGAEARWRSFERSCPNLIVEPRRSQPQFHLV